MSEQLCTECWADGESAAAVYEMHINEAALDPIYACPAHVGYLVRLHTNLLNEPIRVWRIAEDAGSHFNSVGKFQIRVANEEQADE